MTTQEADTRPTFADFAEKHGITMAAALAPAGSTPINDRPADSTIVYRRWYDYFFPRWGGTRKLDKKKINNNLNRATAAARGFIYVADPYTRDMIDLSLTFKRHEGIAGFVKAEHTIAYAVGIGHCKAAARIFDAYDIDQLAIYVETPTIASVLDHLAMEARSVTDALSFEEWAGEFGYETDSRKAEKVYKLCQKQAAALRQFLGHAAFAELTSGDYREE